MEISQPFLAFTLFGLVAILYSTVGHAGASGYLAIMALLSFPTSEIKTTSLTLNILVALVTSVQFLRAGYFDRKIFMAFALTSIPFSYLGGRIGLDPKVFKLLAGIFLIISSILLVTRTLFKKDVLNSSPLSAKFYLPLGALIGFLSGLIGVGGGIFLTPLLILFGVAETKVAGGISAVFILVNSVSGLLGHFNQGANFPHHLNLYVTSVFFGGLLGSWLGVKKFDKKIITLCLSLVLLSAGLKFIFIDYLGFFLGK